MKKIFLFAFFGLFWVSPAWATFSLSMGSSSLSLGTSLDPDNSPFTLPSFAATVRNNGGDAVAVWYLTVYGSGNFASVADASKTVALSALQWKLNASTAYTTMTTSPALVASGGFTAHNDYNFVLRLNLAWSDPYATDYRGGMTMNLSATP